MLDAEPLSAYELERCENIRLNNLRLQELGLDAPSVPLDRAARIHKRKRPQSEVAIHAGEPVRRSSRHRMPVQPYSDDTPLASSRHEDVRPRRREPYEGPDELEPQLLEPATTLVPSLLEREMPRAGSSRSVSLNVTDIVARHIGRHISDVATKDSAVRAMAGKPVSFSKYSGSLEWNNAIVLWVNVGGQDYRNLFLDGGERMTWYASPRNNETTPVVQRLISNDEPVITHSNTAQHTVGVSS